MANHVTEGPKDSGAESGTPAASIDAMTPFWELPPMEMATFAGLLLFGAVVVFVRASERFLEPGYLKRFSKDANIDSSDAYYQRYLPRFTAVQNRFNAARYTYIWINVGFCVLLAVVPGILIAIQKGFLEGVEIPLDHPNEFVIASTLLLIGVHDFPLLKTVTQKICEKLYVWAKIPTGARETAQVLCSHEFDFDYYKKLPEFTNQNEEFGAVQNKDLERRQGSVENRTAIMGCVLYALRKTKVGNSKVPLADNRVCEFDREIFEEYSLEYESILDMHRRMVPAIQAYRDARSANNGDDPTDPVSVQTAADMETLFKKLNTFLACAVLPTVRQENQANNSFRAIGFRLPPPILNSYNIHIVLLTAFAFIVVLSILIWATALPWFQMMGVPRETLLTLHPIDYSMIPREPVTAIIWGIFIVLIHFGAGHMAAMLRDRALRRERWPKTTGHRPYTKYLVLALYGAIVGYLLILVATATLYADLCASGCPAQFWSYVTKTALVAMFWITLPLISGYFAAYHRDTARFRDATSTQIWQIVLQAAIMGCAAVLLLFLYMEFRPMLETADVAHDTIKTAFAFYSVILLGLVGAFLGWYFPYWRRLLFRSRFVGEWTYKLKNYKGKPATFSMRVYRDKEQPNTRIKPTAKQRAEGESGWRSRRGNWRPYERGAIVHWRAGTGDGEAATGLPNLFLAFDDRQADKLYVYTVDLDGDDNPKGALPVASDFKADELVIADRKF